MTVVEEKMSMPFNKVWYNKTWGSELNSNISFAHIFKGSEGVKKNIQTGDEKIHLSHYESLLDDVMNYVH